MSVRYLGTNSPDGTSLGLSTGEKISFYGVSPVAQSANSNQTSVSMQTTATTTALRTDVDNIATLVNQLRADLVSLGAIKGSS